MSSRQFTYRRCLACRCYWIEDQPDDLGAYYPPEYNPRPSLDELQEAGRQEAHRIELARRFIEPGRLTEIGPGSGAFAASARDAGFEVTVVDRDEETGAHLQRVLGAQAIVSDTPERALVGLSPSRLIAMWHVLEHLPAPWETLRAAASNLEPHGLLMLATPNPDAISLRLAGGRWPHVDAPRHLFLLAAKELLRRATSEGLRLVYLTTADPVGRNLNEHAWRYSVVSPLRHPRRPASRAVALGAHLLAHALAPVECRGLRGAAYTAVLRKVQ